MDDLNTLFGFDEAPIPTEKYKLNSMVFVNSAGHNYVEVPLDSHMAMFGNNNKGKTSTLAATKIVLYPEDNFKNSKHKFTFTNKNGVYSDSESYNYYFPSQISYIIMEAENPEGVFTMILYSGNRTNREYHRIFLPVEYAKVRHYFKKEYDNNIDGERQIEQVDDIDISTIKQAISEFDGVNVTKDSEVRELLFGYNSGRDSRYCLVPLTNSSKESINVFKSIYQLAFGDSSNTSNVLAKAIATIAESNYSERDAKLNVNFEALLAEYQEYKNEADEIQLLSETKSRYENLLSNYNNLTFTLDDISVKYAVYKDRLTKDKQDNENKSNTLSFKLNQAKANLETVSEQLVSANRDYSKALSSSEHLKSSISKLLGRIALVGKLKEEQNLPLEKLLERINSEITTKKQYKEAVEDTYKTGQLRIQAQKDRAKVAKEFKELELAKKNKDNNLLNFVSDDSASILNSISPNFANVIHNPNEEQRQIIESFAGLFDVNESEKSINLFNKRIADLKTFDINDDSELEIKIEDLQYQIRNYDANIARYDETLNNKQAKTQEDGGYTPVDIIDQEIKELTEQSNAISAHEANKADVEVMQSELKEIQSSIQEKQQRVEDLKQAKETASLEFKSVDDEKNLLLVQSNEIENMLARLKDMSMHTSFKECTSDVEQYQTVNEALFDINKADIQRLDDDSRKFMSQYKDFTFSIDKMTQAIPCPDADIHTVRNSLSEYADIVSSYKSVFEGLEQKQKVLEGNILAHNSDLSGSITDASRAIDALDYRVKEINDSLSKRQISNLDSVRLKLTIKPEFNFLKDFGKKASLSGSSLIDSEIYHKLIKFVRDNTKGKSGDLILSNLIDSINYEYVTEDGDTSSKEQSGGTTAAITATIMSILMGDICMQGSVSVLPIVIDEINQLDSDNINTIIEQIESMNMTVFCATPSETGKVCSGIEKWINISHNDSGEYRVKGCTTKFLIEDCSILSNIEDSTYTLPESILVPELNGE